MIGVAETNLKKQQQQQQKEMFSNWVEEINCHTATDGNVYFKIEIGFQKKLYS